jgi:putative ABC transport system ATP-binding protein
MLELKKITKTYRKGRSRVVALEDFSHRFTEGRFYAIHGPSGAGKTTLLMMMGGMLRPDSGEAVYGGENIYTLSVAERNRFRKKSVGFVFQRFHLLPYLTVLDNIRLPLTLDADRTGMEEKARAAAERLGLSERLTHYPQELSVGQQQRAAVARVLAGEPDIILADEPTGNLDEVNQQIISECLHQEAEKGKLVVAVTHEQALLKIAHQTIELLQVNERV